MQYHYNTVNFISNPHNRHPIAHPWGWGMECLLWVKFWFLICSNSWCALCTILSMYWTLLWQHLTVSIVVLGGPGSLRVRVISRPGLDYMTYAGCLPGMWSISSASIMPCYWIISTCCKYIFVFFKDNLVIDVSSIFIAIALGWKPLVTSPHCESVIKFNSLSQRSPCNPYK